MKEDKRSIRNDIRRGTILGNRRRIVPQNLIIDLSMTTKVEVWTRKEGSSYVVKVPASLISRLNREVGNSFVVTSAQLGVAVEEIRDWMVN